MARGNRKKSKGRWWKITLIVVGVLVLAVGAYAFSIYSNAKNTVNDQMHKPVEAIDTGLAKKKVKAKDTINVLLLGIDAREGDSGRSDALMVLSMDPKNDHMQLISIPRDTRTEIVGKGKEDKINHAYAFGGNEMAVATVENFLGIELDYYVSMNMDGFEHLVDELGNITVHNDVAWNDGKYDFGFGPTEMDGDKTMAFVRMRKEDPDGDFGRTKRQRQVIQGIINEGASAASVPKINSLIDILGNNMSTNMDFDDMKNLLSNYRDTRKKFDEYQMKGTGTKIGGIYYLVVGNDEVEKVRNMIESEES